MDRLPSSVKVTDWKFCPLGAKCTLCSVVMQYQLNNQDVVRRELGLDVQS